MGWIKAIAVTIGCVAAISVVARMAGIKSKPAKVMAPAKYDLHSDPEYIEMTRRQSVDIDDMKWHLGGFDTVMIASFTIKNERAVHIKDVIVRCDVTAPSGAKLGSPVKTVFQSIGPGKSVKIRDLSMGFVRDAAQAASAVCYVENHSDG